MSWSTAQGQSGQSNLGSGAQGVIGGAHVGYNQQFDHWVLGLEGSVDGDDLDQECAGPCSQHRGADAQQRASPAIGGTVTGTVQSDIQGSVRARAGYAFGRFLPYATAGVAFGSFYTDAQLFGTDLDGVTNFAASGAKSATRVGWTAGAGVEYAINNRWSARAEYRYSDFGHLAIATDPSAVGAVFAVDRQLDQHQVQVGFSYKLFAGPEPEAPPAPHDRQGPGARRATTCPRRGAPPFAAKPALRDELDRLLSRRADRLRLWPQRRLDHLCDARRSPGPKQSRQQRDRLRRRQQHQRRRDRRDRRRPCSATTSRSTGGSSASRAPSIRRS